MLRTKQQTVRRPQCSNGRNVKMIISGTYYIPGILRSTFHCPLTLLGKLKLREVQFFTVT